MSDKQQTPSNVGRALVLIVAAIIIGTLWFMFQSRNESERALNDAENVQQSEENNEQTDEYQGWETHEWAERGVTFKYPGDWQLEENAGIGRLYIKNSDVNLLKEETPDDFQQVWLSYDLDESAASREAAIKNGESEFRVVRSDVEASTIEADGVTINVYEYETLGGPTLEAYFITPDGTRLYATNSTEVGEQNQTEMVATLKKLLASLEFAE